VSKIRLQSYDIFLSLNTGSLFIYKKNHHQPGVVSIVRELSAFKNAQQKRGTERQASSE
jgi:hypothetical protein